MDPETDDNMNGKKVSESVWGGASNGLQEGLNGLFSGEHQYGEHPFRTLFVGNINSNVEDGELRALFEQYGDISKLYTACKHRGFIIISYYDIRAARNAMQALQNKPLKHRKLDIHFSIPKDNPSDKDINQGTLMVFNTDSSVTNEDLHQMFGVYGEIKEINGTLHKCDHFIEFYDVRAAEAALHALDRSDIAGKKIKLQLSHPGGARRSIKQLSPQLDQEKSNGCWEGSPNNFLLECFGSSSLGAMRSNSLENGVIHYLKSTVQAPITPHMEATFHGISSSMPQYLSSAVRIPSVANCTNQAAHADINHSWGQMNFGFQDMHGFHPRSLLDYRNGVTNGSYNSNIMPAVGTGVISRPSEGIVKRHLEKAGSGSFREHSIDPNEVFEVSANESCPLHGHQYVWNNANAFHHKSPNTMFWSNSPSFINNTATYHPSQIHEIPRAQSHIVNTVLPLHHHVGSAPAVNPSLWDRRHAYAQDSMEPPAFHPGSLESMGLSAVPQMNWLETSHNIFSHAGRNCIDLSISPAHIGIPSPQLRG